jgi:ssDNA-binding Zn-finger/Zn-ribbon topoisomerase 1
MSLKVMCAGCSAEEREHAESDVRRALGARATGNETWIVSVINLQGRWSVTVDGPGVRALNCTASSGRLAEAIAEALRSKAAPAAAPAPVPKAAPPPAAAPRPAPTAAPRPAPTAAAPAPRPAPRPAAPPPRAAPGAAGPRRTAHECEQCQKRFHVAFDGVAGEPDLPSPVACPHCWHTNQVPVGETAAATSDYRADKD